MTMKKVTNAKLLNLAAELLDLAGDKFGNHGCNDFKPTDWSPSERRELAIAHEEYNGDTCELERLSEIPEGDSEFDFFSDFCLMFYCAHALREMAKLEDQCEELEEERNALLLEREDAYQAYASRVVALHPSEQRISALESALREIGALSLRGGPVDHGYIFSIVDDVLNAACAGVKK